MYFAGQATMALYPKLTSGTQIGIAAENYDRNLVSGINDNQAKWISLDDNGGEDYDLVKTHNYSTHIEIPANKSITIDLNGFTIDAKKALTSSVFDVKGTLTVKDSSADHDGMMYSKKDTLVCSNVTFEGNKAGTEEVGVIITPSDDLAKKSDEEIQKTLEKEVKTYRVNHTSKKKGR